MSDILAPRCPACEGPPLVSFVLPFFCQNPECEVLSWDPFERPEKFKATVRTVELPSWLDNITTVNGDDL